MDGSQFKAKLEAIVEMTPKLRDVGVIGQVHVDGCAFNILPKESQEGGDSRQAEGVVGAPIFDKAPHHKRGGGLPY